MSVNPVFPMVFKLKTWIWPRPRAIGTFIASVNNVDDCLWKLTRKDMRKIDGISIRAAHDSDLESMVDETAETISWDLGLIRIQFLADSQNFPALRFYKRMGWDSTKLICLRKRGSYAVS
jgi:hypothetical protein